MKRRTVLAGLATGAATALAGCATLSGDVSEGELTGDMDEEEFEAFQSDVGEAMSETETVSVAREETARSDGGTVQAELEADINHPAEEMYMEGDISNPLPTRDGTTFALYIEGTVGYIDEGRDGEWYEVDSEQARDIWDIEDFGSDDPMYRYGEVHVDAGDEVITVTTELDGDQLDAATDEMDEELKTEFEEIEFDEYTTVERFDAETYYLIDIDIDGVGELDGQDVDVEMWSEMTNINEEVETSVPDEVRESASTSSS